MGALNSIHDRLKEFSDADEENEPELSTPQRQLRHKCLVNVDPRSPTENINRTPIIVEGTPNVQLSKGVKSRILSQNDSPVDPRSPSAEFTRTPLNLGGPTFSTTRTSLDTPLKASLDFKPPPSVKQEDVTTIENNTTQEKMAAEQQLCGFLDQSASSFSSSSSSSDNAVTAEESHEDSSSFDTAPLLDSMEKINLSLSNQGLKKSISSDQEAETDDSFSSQSKLRVRPVNRILSQNTSTPPSKGRSPLTLVDNTSRVSSQLPKKSLTTSEGKTDRRHIKHSAVIDKENLCH